MTQTYDNSEILNKGCQVNMAGVLYYCYNVTSLMHFVKCGKSGQILKPNAKNTISMSKDQVLRMVKLNAAVIEVGNL